MTALYVILGGLLTAAVSASVTYVMVPRLVVRALPELLTVLAARPPHDDHQEHTMTTTQPHWRVPATSTMIIVALVAVLVVLAAQVRLSNVAENKSDEETQSVVSCLGTYADQTEAWAIEVNTVLNASRDATAKLRKRTESWTRRVDSIFQLLIRSRADTKTPDAVIDLIVADYQRAKDRLFQSYADAQVTTSENPYPKLTLSCAKESK